MHQRSRYNLPTTEQPSGQRSAHKDELSLPVTAKRMQTAAMRTRSQVKTGNNNNSKVLDSNPHSGPMLRLRANRADNNQSRRECPTARTASHDTYTAGSDQRSSWRY